MEAEQRNIELMLLQHDVLALSSLAGAYSMVPPEQWGSDLLYVDEPQNFPYDLVEDLVTLDSNIGIRLARLGIERPSSWSGGFGYSGVEIRDVECSNRSAFPTVLHVDVEWYLGARSLLSAIESLLEEGKAVEKDEHEFEDQPSATPANPLWGRWIREYLPRRFAVS